MPAASTSAQYVWILTSNIRGDSSIAKKTARLRRMEMFFSDFAANLGGPKNPLYVLHDGLKTEGAKVTDLVRGNVNEHGIVFPPEILEYILKRASGAAGSYRGDSRGQPAAREAIAQYYTEL